MLTEGGESVTHINDELLELILQSAANHLQNNRKMINDLNVFPVPDGDTGTNMCRTFRAAADAVCNDKEKSVGKKLSLLASASLRNARGNSGVILSQILRGVAKGAEDADELGVNDITRAAVLARDTAYRAVMKPTEGTILTVVREIAEFAQEHESEYTDVGDYIEALCRAGQESLAKTPKILPVLEQAGVVDAGGQGIVILLEGVCRALCGNPIQAEEVERTVNDSGANIKTSQKPDDANIKYLYCTEFIIHKKAGRSAAQFTAAIQSKGDCTLVIEDDEIVKVHIHTNHPGFVLEQAVKLGELTDLKIDNMKYQHEERIQQEQQENMEDMTTESLKKYGKVCVSAGEGLTEIFANLGIDAIVEGGQTMNPSTQDLLNAVDMVAAENIFLLPNNKNIILAAEQVQALTDKNIIVLPSSNIPQGISAASVFDEDLSPDENRVAMEDAMRNVKCGQLTYAARDSIVDGRAVKEGQLMGVMDGEIQALGENLMQVCMEMLEHMVNDESGGIFLYSGEAVVQDDAECLCAAIEEKYPDLDVALYRGGQPVYYYIISVE